tara:strand:+ start:231 stop:521 length:291 start_codon:yes stop_codon:yes gene_type:complete
MDQVIKILALTNNQLLISEIVEVAALDIGQPDCKLINPFLIKDGILEPFLGSVTRETTLMMGSDKILTLAEPTPTLLEKYLDLFTPTPTIDPEIEE